MPLGKFFRKREDVADDDAATTEDEASADDASVDAEADVDIEFGEGLPPEDDQDAEAVERSWRDRARDALPGGSSTGSKRPQAVYGEGNTEGPTHFVRASGCEVVTPSDLTLIDCTMALGSVAIGYGDERVVRAAVSAAAAGNVAGLPSTLEVHLAERLIDMIPCAEQVRFLKSGAEAVAAAVRLARAATGRDHVVGCGYFGWHDWSSEGPGIPAPARAGLTRVPFDDVDALTRACRAAGGSLAAIVLEPVIERMPSEEWARTARSLADELGAVLVFDEMKTGFRLAIGGYQEVSGVAPDLATFGKAMANGFPLAAVLGRAAIMEEAERTWISSTLAGESTAIAASWATLDVYEEEDVCATLATAGGAMRAGVARAVAASGIEGVSVDGLDPMWLVRFEDPAIERRFVELAAREGVLFKRGAYNYAALPHADEEIIVEVEHAASSAFVALLEELRG